MINYTTNLFIVNKDHEKSQNLSNFISKTFGKTIIITNFIDGETCLKSINSKTDIVILDNSIHEPLNLELIKKIKTLNSKIEVVVFSHENNIQTIIEAYKKGLDNFVIKENGSVSKIRKILIKIINKPIQILAREFKISTYMATFLLTFISMAVIVLFFLFA
jgi:DNA-binding NtrC family response regulator